MKTCLNPNCNQRFRDHYGGKQRICGRSVCKKWYRQYWSQTRKPPRGLPEGLFRRVQRELRNDPFHESLVAIMAESGLRKGEALGLTWDDLIDDNNKPRKVFIVRGQWQDGTGFRPTKVDAARKAYLLDWGQQALVRWFKQAAPRDRAARIWPIAESTCWRWWVAFQRGLGIDRPFRVHDLRHTAAVRCYEHTRDLRVTQKLVGHRNIQTTVIYTERPDEEVRDELARALNKRDNA